MECFEMCLAPHQTPINISCRCPQTKRTRKKYYFLMRTKLINLGFYLFYSSTRERGCSEILCRMMNGDSLIILTEICFVLFNKSLIMLVEQMARLNLISPAPGYFKRIVVFICLLNQLLIFTHLSQRANPLLPRINYHHNKIKDQLIAHLTLVGHNDIINCFEVRLFNSLIFRQTIFKWTRHFNKQI